MRFVTPYLPALQVEKEKPPINVVGDVHGKIAIMIVRRLHLFVLHSLHHMTVM